MKCEKCDAACLLDDMHHDESGSYCMPCYETWCRQSAIDAGIPESVVDGKTKLTDHFSQEYIDYKCGRDQVLKAGAK